ncbi:hypothetical protein [Planomonospora sp. ID82291]|uniref:hypothetical protein n=1 Tax=Planomonospora sp. ID82291 TaxID=2738136 RepID=UPI0018C3C526|nr:hypothetical protein [Planomonospora sp. ID82291]MBG0818732.1 hypothetical protein [Planomonospora sp. ID82291]
MKPTVSLRTAPFAATLPLAVAVIIHPASTAHARLACGLYIGVVILGVLAATVITCRRRDRITRTNLTPEQLARLLNGERHRPTP